MMASITMVIALALVASPLVAMDDAMATKVKKKGNKALQSITQSQLSSQNSLCVTGTGTLVSCNNLNSQNQANSGNNALAQQGGQEKGGSGSGGGGNTANQGINQAQS